ncbi:endonuclease/exonuclease/phosphatase family protein [Burkholderiaceae bacterium DAT-1]|nr:endonuclease/exonuclease/phosphatase family protein [Burkholderiaceae bacterium DAT-1]
MSRHLTLATMNIHKGMSPLNREHCLPAIRAAIHELDADLIFLQEVQGEHRTRARQHADWPDAPQHEFLAADHHSIYGRNAEYRSGHHGNALLSRYRIMFWDNVDISLNRFERRGLLYASLDIPCWDTPLHAVCVHLNLRAADRRKQLELLTAFIGDHIDEHEPLIVAGDFNDWKAEACTPLLHGAGLTDAYRYLHGRVAASFPARLPVLNLDRIYTRGVAVESAQVHTGRPWSSLSDHIPLSAIIRNP